MESRPTENSTNALPGASDFPSSHQRLDPPLLLRAVKQARQAHQSRLRIQLQQLREDIEQCRQSTRHPLHLFPQEIWVDILANLEDVNDVTNFAQSNNLIFGILLSSPQELLFYKILPHLVPYLGEICATILTCGKVCQKWREAVDWFADHYFCVETPSNDGIEVLTKMPVPDFPNKCLLGDLYLEIRERPFLSELYLQLFQPYYDTFSVLDTAGHCFWKVSLELETFQSYSSQEIYDKCAEVFRKCKNLKRFSLMNPPNGGRMYKFENNGVDLELQLQPSASLESLKILVKSPDILGIQVALIRKLSHQLKRLVLDQWDCKTYHKIPWTNLTELEIVRTSLPVLISLQKMTAPKLFKLTLHWNSDLEFKDVFKTVNSFERLRHLSIQLTETVSDKCLAVPIELITSNQITTLEIYSYDVFKGLDIVVLFPLLRNLICHDGQKAAKRKDFNTTEIVFPTRETCILVCNNVYHSNIWTILPNLETMTLISRETATKISQRKFTRLGYIWATEKHSFGVQMHLKNSRQNQKDAKRLDMKFKYNSLLSMRRARGLHLTPQKLQKNPITIDIMGPVRVEQSFPLIIPHLAQSDLLSCRLVCRNWNITIGDNILNNHMRNIPLTFSVPLSTHKQLQNFVSFVEDNMRKPFFARTVKFQIIEESGCVDGVEMMLADLGKYIRHLSIKTEIALDLTDVYKICVDCLKQCSNLQSFSLHIPLVENNTAEIFDELKKSTKITKPKGLISFSFNGQGFENIDTGMGALRAFLQVSFAHQIRNLVVPRSFGESTMPLRELTITDYKTELEIHRYFGQLQSELKKLRLCINQQELWYRDLHDIIVKCMNLEYLELQFTNECFSYDRNLVHWDLDIAPTVTEIQIVFKNKYQICLDFLVHFPNVKILHFVYGQIAPLLNEDFGRSAQHAECYFPLEQVRKPENDFIQLTKYFKDDNVVEHSPIGIQESNVWDVLPKLKVLEIAYCPKNLPRNRKVFTRKS